MNQKPALTEWDKEIKELEDFFSKNIPSKKQYFIEAATSVENVTLFIRSHLKIIKSYRGNKNFLPYLNRLIKFKTIIEQEIN